MNYSVLMSVYKKEKPEYLKTAIDSMLEQSVATNDFVLVCDGPLTDSLDEVISNFERSNPGLFNVVRLPENVGLATALNEGIKHCKNDIVARMDSDDYSKSDRIKKQLDAMEEKGVDIVGSNVFEFDGDITNLTHSRNLPEFDEDIREFAKSRSPFNHPSVVYKKSKVELLGGYGKFDYFEDYYLWVTLLQNGCKGYNVQEYLVLMRSGEDLYLRRGGKEYAKCVLAFKKHMLSIGYITRMNYLTQTTARVLVAVMPNNLRAKVYKKRLRG
ncbi:MAG: glycosyltransferase [Eubacterium sp.]|nr:glycosyltransferase [Eubacterium sp.]